MMSGAQQLQDWMKRRGFSAKEAAAYFGWDFTFISKLVNGRRSPGLSNAIAIERKTGIPVEAWMSSALDRDAETVTTHRGKRL